MYDCHTRYIKLDLYENKDKNPILVRIEKDQDIDYDILKEISQFTTGIIKQGVKWEDDFSFIEEIMEPFAKKYNFQYQIIFADINIYGY